MSTSSNGNGRQLLSVAPMMDWTDVHYRQLARLISRHTWLWTEMVVDKTILNSPHPDRFLWFPKEQKPLVLQMGGSEPESVAAAARVAIEYGYDEINLNCGCPSDRVAGAGCFGASLMLEPELVGDCMRAMGDAASGTPVNVKCRLGVDQDDSYEALQRFVKVVSERSSVRHFIIHARKAFLKGLNPHQNRSVPPLRYEWLFGLKRDFPHLMFSLNGGIQSPYEALAYINHIPNAASALHQDAHASSGDRADKADEDLAPGLIHTADHILQAANGATEGANTVSASGSGAGKVDDENAQGMSHIANGGLQAANGVADGAHGVVEGANGVRHTAHGILPDASGASKGANGVSEGAHCMSHAAHGATQAANGGATDEANRDHNEGASGGRDTEAGSAGIREHEAGTAGGALQNGASARSLKRGAGEVVDDGREAEFLASGDVSGQEAPPVPPTPGSVSAAATPTAAAAAAETTRDAERMQSNADASTSGAAVPNMGREAPNGVSKPKAPSVSHNRGQGSSFEDGNNLAAPLAPHMVPPGVAAVEGVMIGRAAYNDPWGVLGNTDKAVFGADSNPAVSRRQVLSEYCKYAETVVGSWGCKPDGHREPSVRTVFKPLLNLFHGEKGSKRWKQEVDALLKTNPPSVEYVLANSLHLLEQEALDSPPRVEPCMEEALRGRFSAAPGPKVVLGPLPRPSDRAGVNQDPNGIDSKRLCMAK